MINKLILISLCVLAVGSGRAADWGESVQGVQMAVTMTNSVFPVGSSSEVTAIMTNFSTNTIRVIILAPTVDFDVLLANDTGKLYYITSPIRIRLPGKYVEISPGGEQIESIPVTFGKDIDPGDYTLKASRSFKLNGKEYKIESNSIKVKVVK